CRPAAAGIARLHASRAPPRTNSASPAQATAASRSRHPARPAQRCTHPQSPRTHATAHTHQPAQPQIRAASTTAGLLSAEQAGPLSPSPPPFGTAAFSRLARSADSYERPVTGGFDRRIRRARVSRVGGNPNLLTSVLGIGGPRLLGGPHGEE